MASASEPSEADDGGGDGDGDGGATEPKWNRRARVVGGVVVAAAANKKINCKQAIKMGLMGSGAAELLRLGLTNQEPSIKFSVNRASLEIS
jgi:hypothetical protein